MVTAVVVPPLVLSRDWPHRLHQPEVGLGAKLPGLTQSQEPPSMKQKQNRKLRENVHWCCYFFVLGWGCGPAAPLCFSNSKICCLEDSMGTLELLWDFPCGVRRLGGLLVVDKAHGFLDFWRLYSSSIPTILKQSR